MKLDELVVEWDQIEALLEANGGEATPEIEAQLDALCLAESEKLDNYCFKIKALQGDCDYLKAAEDELAAKRKAKAKLREWLLARAHFYMDTRGTTQLQGRIYKMKLQASGKPPVEVLVPAEDLPRPFATVTVVANKEALRDGLTRGLLPPGLARFGAPTISVRIY